MMIYPRKRKEKTELKKIAKQTLKEMLTAVRIFFKTNVNLFLGIFQILVMIFLCYLFLLIHDILPCILLCIVALFVVDYIKRLNVNVQNMTDDGLPVPVERFTEMKDGGYISIEKEEESIQYLYELENYLERKGLLKHEKSL